MSARTAINPERYGKLLAKTLPAVIGTKKEYERLLKEAEKLFDKGEENLSAEEQRVLELLVHLIQEYEESKYAVSEVPPPEMLLHIMESRDLKPKDLWPVFRSKGITSEVLNGKRTISKAQAKALAEFFKVSVELFI